MMTRFLPLIFGRLGRVLVAAGCAFLIGAAVHARAMQNPSTPAQPPSSQTPPAPPARQGQPAAGAPAAQQVDEGPVRDASGAVIGFTKLAEIPGTPWRVHDASRPHPRAVTPGAAPAAPPSDAIVLFDGKDLSKWAHVQNGQMSDAKWLVRDGYAEVVPRTGAIVTRDKFGDVQLHLEWMAPSPARGASQDRGNSGVTFMGRYEVQVLDSYESITYADGQAGSIYGEHPPLVNAAKKPGEWQYYDIVFEAPKFNGQMTVAPAYVTVFWNGVLVQHRRAVMGSTSATRTVHAYTPHDPELPLSLQDHSHPVRYRNIWIRKLAGYDQPEK